MRTKTNCFFICTILLVITGYLAIHFYNLSNITVKNSYVVIRKMDMENMYNGVTVIKLDLQNGTNRYLKEVDYNTYINSKIGETIVLNEYSKDRYDNMIFNYMFSIISMFLIAVCIILFIVIYKDLPKK